MLNESVSIGNPNRGVRFRSDIALGVIFFSRAEKVENGGGEIKANVINI